MRLAPRHVYLAAAVAAIAVGTVFAIWRYWICDDAYITYRYAENLANGHGLVFNHQDRVEGFTNLAWTLYTALGIWLGCTPEAWTAVSGIACFALTLALLAWHGWRTGADLVRQPLPIAALLGAAHTEWAVFATSGLETSAFTLLAFAGYLLVAPHDPRRAHPASPRAMLRDRPLQRLALAGAVLALCSLTRPDGVLFAAGCGAWLAASRDLRGTLAFGAGFVVLWAPVTLWRVAYYGDIFPNTYYAKSAALTWWSQGWFYAQIYFTRYWPLLAAIPLAVVVKPRRAAALPLVLAVVYALYVMRVGGDFMFGRLLVPVTPFALVLIEQGLRTMLAKHPVIRATAAAALLVAMYVMPASAVKGGQRPRGIADERDAYTRVLAGWGERADKNGAVLARLFDGLPVSVAFFGAQARLVYRSKVATAIECETGLTDATIAHQALRERGRIGHEKHAHLQYLLDRHVQFTLAREWANEILKLDAEIPDVPVDFGALRARMITYDPDVVLALRARGARIPDVPAQLDAYIAGMSQLPLDLVRRDYERYRRLYFDHVTDPAREAPFRARLR